MKKKTKKKKGGVMSLQRTWNMQPRPRSPWQIIPLLATAKPFLAGKNWIEKDATKRPGEEKKWNRNQLELREALGATKEFELDDSTMGNMEQQGRTYLTMNPVRLGLCWKNEISKDDHRIEFTAAADALIKKENIEQIWLKQMVKWQVPSYVDKEIHMQKYSCHPFLSAIHVCLLLGKMKRELDQEFLSKWEYATFILTMTYDNEAWKIAKDILSVRKKVLKMKDANKNKERRKYAIRRLRKIFKEDIAKGSFSKRQQKPDAPKPTISSELDRRQGCTYENDYADTTMRYMRATGIFIASDRTKRLRLDPRKRWKAIELVKDKKLFKIKPYWNDAKKFYSWFGDPNEPKLPWESIPGYNKEISENLSQIHEILVRM